MRLLFKQRFLSWLGGYNILNEANEVVFRVQGTFSWGRYLTIYGADGNELGAIRERCTPFFQKYEIYHQNIYLGTVSRRVFTMGPVYDVDYNGWRIIGNMNSLAYSIVDERGHNIAAVSKKLLHLTDTYTIHVSEKDALYAVMLVLVIDLNRGSLLNIKIKVR